MSVPPRPSFADADIHLPFQNSASRSSAENYRLFPLLKMRWAKAEASEQKAKRALIHFL